MQVIVTGGAGYIGSHTCVALLEAGHAVTVLDNLANASQESLRRAQALTGKKLCFKQLDLRNLAGLRDFCAQVAPDACLIHFAGLKSVADSARQPLYYYQHNLECTLNLCQAMTERGLRRLVFSSSATVYGIPAAVPVPEDAPLAPYNPYGRIKAMSEQILRDLHQADTSWKLILLRYFNPVGAHPSGRMGEDPLGEPNNLLPYIAQVAVGRREFVPVFGKDYLTKDGSGVRDYIHVMDLARGHLCALERLELLDQPRVYNLGRGQGHSVFEMIDAFARASGRAIPYQIHPRRPGDIAEYYADPSRAERELGWKAQYGIDAMCQDAWRWQSNNPQGYGVSFCP